MTVLVVRAADLQTAASAQLKDTLAQAKTGLDLVPQQPVQLKQVKNTSPSNGSFRQTQLYRCRTGRAAHLRGCRP